MTGNSNGSAKDRRSFLKELTAYSGGLALTGYATNFAGLLASPAHAQGVVGGVKAPTSTALWTQHAGLELYTVRDQMTDAKSYEATLAKVSEIGYNEVEPANGYAGLDPAKEADAKKFRTTLDSYGLSMPSTHSGATEGPDLEKQLNGFAIMGLRYIGISAPRSAAPARATAPPPVPPVNGAVREPVPQTTDQVKRQAEALNTHGKLAAKFGMKMLVHNHTQEFAPLADHPDQRPYDILLANTDPSLVAMQLDIGWASVAGQDILAMFKKNPGRYELWHVKDASGIPHMTPQMTMAQRMSAADLVPVGLGTIDYKAIFEGAQLAGMKHYCVEQDNANSWGDSIAAAKTSYDNLQRMLA